MWLLRENIHSKKRDVTQYPVHLYSPLGSRLGPTFCILIYFDHHTFVISHPLFFYEKLPYLQLCRYPDILHHATGPSQVNAPDHLSRFTVTCHFYPGSQNQCSLMSDKTNFYASMRTTPLVTTHRTILWSFQSLYLVPRLSPSFSMAKKDELLWPLDPKLFCNLSDIHWVPYKYIRLEDLLCLYHTRFGPESSLPTSHTHLTFALSKIFAHSPWLDQAVHSICQTSPFCSPDISPTKPFPSSRPTSLLFHQWTLSVHGKFRTKRILNVQVSSRKYQ